MIHWIDSHKLIGRGNSENQYEKQPIKDYIVMYECTAGEGDIQTQIQLRAKQ
jgi:hypothetical protein